MKGVFFILIVSLLTNNLYAQKKGYKEMQIGADFNGIKALHKYKISLDTAKQNCWLVAGDSLTMCTMTVDHIEVIVNDKNMIRQIELDTKQVFYKEYNDWLYDLKYVLNYVNFDVRKINSDDLSRHSSNEVEFAWSFADTKTALILNVPKISSSNKNFESNCTFFWIEDAKNWADQKFKSSK